MDNSNSDTANTAALLNNIEAMLQSMDNSIPNSKPSQKPSCQQKNIKRETKEVSTSFKKISPKLSPKKATDTVTSLIKQSPAVETLNSNQNVLHMIGSKPIILQSIQTAPATNTFPVLNNTIVIDNLNKINSNIEKSPKAKKAKTNIEVISQTSPSQTFHIQTPQNPTLILSPMISNLPNQTVKEAVIVQPVNLDVRMSNLFLVKSKIY